MRARWILDKRKNILMLFFSNGDSRIRKPMDIFEVERADIIIDADNGSVLEIQIPVTNEEIKHIVELLRKKSIKLHNQYILDYLNTQKKHISLGKKQWRYTPHGSPA